MKLSNALPIGLGCLILGSFVTALMFNHDDTGTASKGNTYGVQHTLLYSDFSTVISRVEIPAKTAGTKEQLICMHISSQDLDCNWDKANQK